MKSDFTDLNRHRIRSGRLASDDSAGRNGAFAFRRGKTELFCICSDGAGWEHVSVHARGFDLKQRTPTWEEMCWIKSQFFEAEESCVQYHPRESAYVNNHAHCLHLFRPIDVPMPEPPEILVGIKELGVLK